MTAEPLAPSASGAVGLLERSIGYTRVSLTWVTPAVLPAPTPCGRWDLRALLGHLDDSLAALTEATEEHGVRPTPVSALDIPADIVTSLRARACALLAAWTRHDRTAVRVGDLPLPAGLLLAAGSLDIAVHGWDVARACGVKHPLPEGLACDLLRIVPVVVAPDDRPTRFGRVRPVDAGAAPSDRLLALLGRQP